MQNSGTEYLKNFTVTDTLVDAAGNTLSLNATPTSSDPDLLAPGGVKTYVASYTIAQNALDNGGVKNSALVRASNVASITTSSQLLDPCLEQSKLPFIALLSPIVHLITSLEIYLETFLKFAIDAFFLAPLV